jgi:hypothetical protein
VSRARHGHQDNLPEIHTIAGGFGGGGETSLARKAYALEMKDFQVYSVERLVKSRRCESPGDRVF